MYVDVHRITICKSPKLETSQIIPELEYKLWNNHKMEYNIAMKVRKLHQHAKV